MRQDAESASSRRWRTAAFTSDEIAIAAGPRPKTEVAGLDGPIAGYGSTTARLTDCCRAYRPDIAYDTAGASAKV